MVKKIIAIITSICFTVSSVTLVAANKKLVCINKSDKIIHLHSRVNKVMVTTSLSPQQTVIITPDDIYEIFYHLAATGRKLSFQVYSASKNHNTYALEFTNDKKNNSLNVAIKEIRKTQLLLNYYLHALTFGAYTNKTPDFDNDTLAKTATFFGYATSLAIVAGGFALFNKYCKIPSR